ncbi:glycoside hydrolase family 43 protein [Roseateles sp. UC29_93]|uniref:glycoside hydrolase family 43 protein n=1 Tax=Roseateles sp. UC29_93 TaxID=3350177 RepID=UPI00366EFF50
MSDLTRRTLLAQGGAAALVLTGCGGGGSSGADASPAAPAPGPAVPPPPPPPAPPAPTQTPVLFTEVSVHDPSVIRADGSFYIFGSHLGAAKTSDLMNWTSVADGVNNANPLFNQVTTALADTFAWAQVTDLWAPDVARLDDGKYRMYYCACKGDSPRSALGVAIADAVQGPYVNQQILLKSGQWGLPSEDGTIYDATVHPNVVDPQVFKDAAGRLWMVYGSYSGGLFILELDRTSGLPLAGQGYGKHLMGGNHARIEGAYVLYSPASQYYYLFCSFGGLDANGGYNLRVSRSRLPDGPYVDGRGTDMATVKGAAGTLFDDASITPHGQKLMGGHQWALASGETGTAPGYVSPGHNSAYLDAATGQFFLIFHTRFPGTGELHQVRVHEMFLNADDWLVAAPFRYAPLSLAVPAVTATVGAADAVGGYQLINHGLDITATSKTSVAIRLAGDGTVSGGATGTWTHQGNNRVSVVLNGSGTAGGTFAGVLSRQWNTKAGAFVVTFTAQSSGGVSLWAARTGD